MARLFPQVPFDDTLALDKSWTILAVSVDKDRKAMPDDWALIEHPAQQRPESGNNEKNSEFELSSGPVKAVKPQPKKKRAEDFVQIPAKIKVPLPLVDEFPVEGFPPTLADESEEGWVWDFDFADHAHIV